MLAPFVSNITVSAWKNITFEENTSLDILDLDNFTNLLNHTIPLYWKWETIISFTIRIIWCIFGLVGNLLTLLAIWKFDYLQTVTNYNIVSLAVADLLSALCILMDLAKEGDHPLWIFTCVSFLLLFWSGSCGNIFSMFCISVERFIFIHRPLYYYNVVTGRRIVTCLTILWLYFTLGVLSFFIIAIPQLNQSGVCNLRLVIYPCLNCVMQPHFWTFSLIIIVLSLKIGHTAYKQHRAIQQSIGSSSSNHLSNRKITKMLGFILDVYIALKVPMVLISAVGLFCNLGLFQCISRTITLVDFQVNIWINPIIYYVNNKDFKKAYRNLLHLD